MQADIPQAASGTRTRQIEAARGRRKEKIWATFDRFGTKSPAFSAFLASSVSLDCKSSGRGRRDNIVRTRSDRKLSEGIKRREKGRSMIQMEFVRRRRLFFVVHVKKTLPAGRVQNFDFSPSPSLSPGLPLFISPRSLPHSNLSTQLSASRKARAGVWCGKKVEKVNSKWLLPLTLPASLSRPRLATLSSSSTTKRPRRPATTSWSSPSAGTTTGPR